MGDDNGHVVTITLVNTPYAGLTFAVSVTRPQEGS